MINSKTQIEDSMPIKGLIFLIYRKLLPINKQKWKIPKGKWAKDKK